MGVSLLATSYSTDLPANRKAQVLRYIENSGSATIRELSALLKVSEATIRRDLDELNSENRVERIHGGALISKTSRTSFECAYQDKAKIMTDEKKRIGFQAASYVEDGETVLLDSGTTSLQIAMNLSSKKNITVITYDLYIANAAVLDASSTLIVTGGMRRPDFGVLTGSMVQDFIREIRVDKAFLGADAVDVKFGVSNATFHEVDLKKALIHAAQKVYLVADHSKFGNLALMHVCGLNEIDLIVTDRNLPQEMQAALKSANYNCVLV